MALFNAVAGDVRAATLRVGCAGCPLSNEWGKLRNPKIPPDTGGARGNKATVYFLGEAPGSTEDELGRPFVGDSGQLLRRAVRNWTTPYIIGNVCRCRPPGNRTPTEIESIACWKGYGEVHLTQSSPTVVVPMGNTALHRFFKGNISEWNGLRIPHREGDKTFWIFPVYHPSFLLHHRTERGDSDYQKLWNEQLQRLDREARLWTPPKVPSVAEIKDDIFLLQPNEYDKGRYLLYENTLTAAPDALLAVDYETNGLMPWEKGARLLSASISNGKITIAFLVDHPDNPYITAAYDFLFYILDNAVGLIAHSAIFEQRWSAYKWKLRAFKWRWHDTMSRPYAQLGVSQSRDDEKGAPGRVAALGKQTRLHFGFDVKDITNVDPVRWRQTPVPDLLLYNGLDSKWTHRLWHEPLEPWALPEVERQGHATRAAAAISWRGMLVDQEELGRQTRDLESHVSRETQLIMRAPQVVQWEIDKHTTFNPSSPDQVAQFFGLDSADEEALRQVDDELAKQILKLRKIDKLLGTYAKGIKRWIYPDGYLHPDLSTMFVATGRWASRNPNAQNMPKRENKTFRRVIVAPKGYALVSIDYAQLEARCIAIATADATMLGYVWADQDIHKEWAIRLLNDYPAIGQRLAPEKVRAGEHKAVLARVRGEMKNGLVFPSFYGAGLNKCAGELQVPTDVLGPILIDFWKKYEGARRWQDTVHNFYADHFYIETMTQRRRFAPLSWTEQLNSPIQGTGSDIVVDAAIRLVDLAVEMNDPNFVPMVNIHDDLSFYIPIPELDRYIPVIAQIMVTPRFEWITVPLKVEVSVGHANWSDQHELRAYTTADFHSLPKSGLEAQIRSIQTLARSNGRGNYRPSDERHGEGIAERSASPNAARRQRLSLNGNSNTTTSCTTTDTAAHTVETRSRSLGLNAARRNKGTAAFTPATKKT